jgi:hypothetical protein
MGQWSNNSDREKPKYLEKKVSVSIYPPKFPYTLACE